MKKIEKLMTVAIVAEVSGPDWDEDRFVDFLSTTDPAFVATDAKGASHAEWFHVEGERTDRSLWSQKSWTIFIRSGEPHTPRASKVATGSYRGTAGTWYFIRTAGGPLPPFVSDAARAREESGGGGPL